MSEIAREIESQPDCWIRAADLAVAVADRLPHPGERVAVTGCGTSSHVAAAYAALREAAGAGETDAYPASEFPAGRVYDRIVAISRSGTTTEVADLLGALHGRAPITAVVAVDRTPIADAADHTVVLGFADERSVVQTRFATSALALFRTHVGDPSATPVDDGRIALRASLPFPPDGFEHAVFLGHGWTVGLADEAALKVREAAQVHAESYPAMEYRHGPISVAGPASVVWILGSPDPSIAADIRATGARVREADLDPMAELVLVQRTAAACAEARGLDPDHPRHLSRSVVLT